MTARGPLIVTGALRGRRWAPLVPVPMGAARLALSVARALGLSLPFDAENLDGLERNHHLVSASDLVALGLPTPTPTELVAELLGEA